MEQGRVLAYGAPMDLLQQYSSNNFDEMFIRRRRNLDE